MTHTTRRGMHATIRRGMTLIEMIMALVIFSLVMAGALGMLRAESASFALGSDRTAMNQNGRFALNEMEKDLRTSGTSAPDVQPQIIYIADQVMAFNANYTTSTPDDVEAVYYNPDAPASAVMAMRTTAKLTIPFTSIQYPDSNYSIGATNSSAETIIFYFVQDSSTPRADDYSLYRTVNTLTPELVSTNILKTTGLPFFQYFKITTTAGTLSQTIGQITSGLPWRHTVPVHLGINDTGAVARIDSIRAVRVNFTVSNGKAGTAERLRTLSRLIRLPNVGLVNTKSCGDAPIFVATPSALNAFAADGITRVVTIRFVASVDENGGERDVERYVIWRKRSTETEWGDPYVTLPGGAGPYIYTDYGITSGAAYSYAVAAQDCTPTISGLRTSPLVTIP